MTPMTQPLNPKRFTIVGMMSGNATEVAFGLSPATLLTTIRALQRSSTECFSDSICRNPTEPMLGHIQLAPAWAEKVRTHAAAFRVDALGNRSSI